MCDRRNNKSAIFHSHFHQFRHHQENMKSENWLSAAISCYFPIFGQHNKILANEMDFFLGSSHLFIFLASYLHT